MDLCLRCGLPLDRCICGSSLSALEVGRRYIDLVNENITKPYNGWHFEVLGELVREDGANWYKVCYNANWYKVCYNANEALQFYTMLRQGDRFKYRRLSMHRGDVIKVIAEWTKPTAPPRYEPEHGWTDLEDLERALSNWMDAAEVFELDQLVKVDRDFATVVHKYICAEKERGDDY